MIYLRKYGAATTVDFALFEPDGVDFCTNAVYASGDVKIMKNEGTEANTASGFTDRGTGYSIALSATEMEAARIVIYVIDQTATKVWLDREIVIETYGNASAQHAFDLSVATQKVDLDTIKTRAVTCAAAVTVLASVGTAATSTAQTGDSYARIGTTGSGLTSLASAANLATVDGIVDAILEDTGTTLPGLLATIDGVVDAILADTGTDGVQLSATMLTRVADYVLRRGFAAAAASSDGDTKAFRSLLGAIAKLVNKLEASGGTLTIYEADDSTALGTQAITGDSNADPITGLDTN